MILDDKDWLDQRKLIKKQSHTKMNARIILVSNVRLELLVGIRNQAKSQTQLKQFHTHIYTIHTHNLEQITFMSLFS